MQNKNSNFPDPVLATLRKITRRQLVSAKQSIKEIGAACHMDSDECESLYGSYLFELMDAIGEEIAQQAKDGK